MFNIRQISCCFLFVYGFTKLMPESNAGSNFSKNSVDVYFDALKVALANNGQGIYIAARYNGHPIEWDINFKKIRVVEGEGKFEFL